MALEWRCLRRMNESGAVTCRVPAIEPEGGLGLSLRGEDSAIGSFRPRHDRMDSEVSAPHADD